MNTAISIQIIVIVALKRIITDHNQNGFSDVLGVGGDNALCISMEDIQKAFLQYKLFYEKCQHYCHGGIYSKQAWLVTPRPAAHWAI